MTGARWNYGPAKELTLPDDPETLAVAYRVWQVRNPEYGLRGIHPLCPSEWPQRRERASCLARPIHGRAGRSHEYVSHDEADSPVLWCRCGLAGEYAVEDVLAYRSTIAGVISVSGRVILHDRSLRAEVAQVEALALHGDVSADDREVIERTAAAWNVPVIRSGELREFALAVGQEITHRPTPSTPAFGPEIAIRPPHLGERLQSDSMRQTQTGE
jgi:hypothetical protein